MRSLRSRLYLFAECIAALLFLAMFAAFLVQVFARYIMNDPIGWTQEFVLITYIWIVFWCGAFLVRERDHITFDMAFEALPPGARRRLAIVLTAIVAIAFVVALPDTIDYIAFMKIEKSPMLRIPVRSALFDLRALHGGSCRRRNHPHQAPDEPGLEAELNTRQEIDE